MPPVILRERRSALQARSVAGPPLQLLLGTNAVFLAGLATAGRREEDPKWKELSSWTDLPGLPDFAGTPIAKMLLGRRR